jgi:iron complex outermembrane receptor protein
MRSYLADPSKQKDKRQSPKRVGRRLLLWKTLCVFYLVVGVAIQVQAAEVVGDGQASDVSGAAPLKQLSLAQLGNLEVTTTSKEPEEVWKTPAAIYVLTQDDIRRSGATSIPEVLRLVPGVEVAQVNSNIWSVGIRGFGSAFSKSVLVMIDGRSVYTPMFAGVYWDVQNVMLSDVERIEVIRGPGGTIWGSNAVNGVINIITKSAEHTHGSYASYAGGNIEQSSGAVRYGGAYGAMDYRVYAMGFGRSPEFHPDGDNYDAWQLGQAGFRTDSRLSDRDTLTLQGDLYKGSVGQQVSVGVLSPPAQLNLEGTEDPSGGNLLARWRRNLSDRSDIQVQGYYDRTYRVGPQLGESRNTFDLDFIHHFLIGDRNEVIWGAGAHWSPSKFIEVVPTTAFVPAHEDDNLYSTFVQDQIALLQNQLWLTLGSKFEHNIYTGWENEPSARLLWTPTSHQSVWAAVTRAVRTPSRIDEDLQLTQVAPAAIPIFVCVCDDGKFQSEKLLGYETGYRRLITSKFYVDFAAFHNKYNDLENFGDASVAILTSPPPLDILISFPFANGIMGTSNGGEIAPDFQLNRNVELRATYSYTSLNLEDRITRTNTSDVQTDEGSSPHHEGTIQALLNLPKGFEFDPTFRYVGALPVQGLRSYSTADARVSWHFTREMTLSLTGQNLLQPRHAESGPVLIERGAYAQITWNKPAE